MPQELIDKIQRMSLEEINARMAEIDKEVRSLTDPKDIDLRTEELKELKARKGELEAAVKRADEARGIEEGTVKTEDIEERKKHARQCN